MFDNISDTADFIVVYPDAINSVWDTIFSNSPIDDVGFISALLDTVSKNYKIDSLRVFSTGLSMGGFMTYRLGCELSGRVAAVASVAGPVIPVFFDEFDNTPPIPVLHIHGTADTTILYDGGGIWPPVDSLIGYFVNKNNCPEVDSTAIADVNASDSCTAVKYHYGFCDDSSEVVFYKIFNGGHTWPGGLINIPNLGNTNRDFSASAEIWDFFSRHRLIQNAASTNNFVTKNEWMIFPNPNEGKFHLSVIDPKDSGLLHSIQYTVNKITVTNILGDEIYNSPDITCRIPVTIDISPQPKGIYFLKISDDEKVIITEKIIIE